MASSKMDKEFIARSLNFVNMVTEQTKKHMIREMEQSMEYMTEQILAWLNGRTSCNFHDGTSQGIHYQLVFADELEPEIYTDTKIGAKIKLVDTISGAIVDSDPLSSTNIKIVVLDGDLDFNDQKNWTEKEFDAKVVKERKDKRPLVIGDLDIALSNGVGIFNNLKFTDNSSWIDCRQFRLSARAVNREVRIKEAISNPFMVKERRSTIKPSHPSLDDEVWHLVGIGKGGMRHQELLKKGIYTVRDFKQRMHKGNCKQLKDILKCTDRQWKQIVEHASKAVDSHKSQPPAKRCCIQETFVKSQIDWANGLTGPVAQHPEFPIPQQSVQAAAYNHPTQPSDFSCGDPNTRMEELQATGKVTTDTNLDYGTTSQDPKSARFPVSANLSYIQEALVGSQNDQAHNLASLQAEPIGTPTTGLPSDPACGDHNTRMEGLQPTCNETTVKNSDCGTTSQDPMSTCFPVSANLSSCIQETFIKSQIDWAYGLTGPVAQHPEFPIPQQSVQAAAYNHPTQPSDFSCGETFPSLAYGMTSQAPTSISPSVTALWEHSIGSRLPFDDSGADLITSFSQYPIDVAFELAFRSLLFQSSL